MQAIRGQKGPFIADSLHGERTNFQSEKSFSRSSQTLTWISRKRPIYFIDFSGRFLAISNTYVDSTRYFFHPLSDLTLIRAGSVFLKLAEP